MTIKSLERIAQEAAREWYSRVSPAYTTRMDELSALILAACEKAYEQGKASVISENIKKGITGL